MLNTASRNLAQRLSLVDTKLKEVLAPNQSLIWGIPSIDGFDGGLLPTRYYSAFSTLLTPDGTPTVDGRLREALALEDCRGACIPDLRILNLSNMAFLITDKVYDLWQDGISYDTADSRAAKCQTVARCWTIPPAL